MVHPVLFKDRCSCGGRLHRVDKFGNKVTSSDEVSGLRCDSCKEIYFISWDISTDEPKPLFSKKDAINSFLYNFKKIGGE